MSDEETRAVVDALYQAFLAGDGAGMLAQLADDAHVRFLGQADLHGREAAARFFAFSAGLLHNVEFRISKKIIDGERAAVLWEETAETADGHPWQNHGVDVIRVRDGRIVELHEHNDVRMVHRHFPAFEG